MKKTKKQLTAARKTNAAQGRVMATGNGNVEPLIISFQDSEERDVFLNECIKQWKRPSGYKLIARNGLPAVEFSNAVHWTTMSSNVEREYSFFESTKYIIDNVNCIMMFKYTERTSGKSVFQCKVFTLGFFEKMFKKHVA